MACDLKIEMFAHKLFHKLSYDMGQIEIVPDILEIYADECARDQSSKEACDDLIIKAACCRSDFLSQKYMSSVFLNEMKKIGTLPDAYDYVVRMCDRDDLFGHLAVFERMLATSNFVVNICHVIHENNKSFADILKCGHLLWSMYFDKFAEEFYEKGGWSKLKREAKSYELLSEFDTISYGHSIFYLQAIKEAVVNFSNFKNAIKYQEQRHHPVHISVLWIQFRKEFFESYINIPLSYETSVSAYEADLLLEDLKLLLNSTRFNPDNLQILKEKHQNRIFSTEMSYSENHSALEERKASQDGKIQIQFSGFDHEIKSIDDVSDEFSHICTNLKEESQIRCQTSATAFDIDPNNNLGLVDNTITEIGQMRQTSRLDNKYSHNGPTFIVVDMKRPSETSIKNLPNISDFDLDYICRSKSHMNKKDDVIVEQFHEGNAGRDILNTDEISSIYRMEGTECQKMSSSKNHANFSDLSSTNETVSNRNETENCKKVIKISLCSKNGWSETGKSTEDSTSSKIAVHQRNGKTTSEVLPTLKNFCSVNETSNTGNEISRNRIARNELRKEQNDHEVKKFLRMLQVMGDMEGTEFVLSTLQDIEEVPENTQESSNKQKRKKEKLKAKGTESVPSALKKENPEKIKESLNQQKRKSKKKKSKK